MKTKAKAYHKVKKYTKKTPHTKKNRRGQCDTEPRLQERPYKKTQKNTLDKIKKRKKK